MVIRCTAVAFLILTIGSAGSAGTLPRLGSSARLDDVMSRPQGLRGPSATWIRPDARRAPLAYISDYEHDAVVVFNAATGTQMGQIGGMSAAAGLFVDRRHRLWVANSGNGQILVFERGSAAPSKVLSDPSERPFDVTVCPNGTAYVSNYYSTVTGIGGISVYKKGHTTPTGMLADPNEFENFFITCDRSGNVFTSLQVAGLASQVDEYPAGAGPAKKIVSVDSAGGIAIDPAGNLVVDDPDAHVIAEYSEAGIATGNTIATGSTRLIFDIAVSKDGKTVLGANAGGSGQSFGLWSGIPVTTYSATFVEPIGAAYDPPFDAG